MLYLLYFGYFLSLKNGGKHKPDKYMTSNKRQVRPPPLLTWTMMMMTVVTMVSMKTTPKKKNMKSRYFNFTLLWSLVGTKLRRKRKKEKEIVGKPALWFMRIMRVWHFRKQNKKHFYLEWTTRTMYWILKSITMTLLNILGVRDVGWMVDNWNRKRKKRFFHFLSRLLSVRHARCLSFLISIKLIFCHTP